MADHTFTLTDEEEADFAAAGRNPDQIIAAFINEAAKDAAANAVRYVADNLRLLSVEDRADVFTKIAAAKKKKADDAAALEAEGK